MPARRCRASRRSRMTCRLLVQQQYEENPYPRWVRTACMLRPTTFDVYLHRQLPLAHLPRPRQAGGRAGPDRRLRDRPALDRDRPEARRRRYARGRSQPDQPVLCAAKDACARIDEFAICASRYHAIGRDRPDLRPHRGRRRTAPSRRPARRLAGADLDLAAGRNHARRPLQRAGAQPPRRRAGFHRRARLWQQRRRHPAIPAGA